MTGNAFDQSAVLLSFFDALPATATILDENGHIVVVNRAWREFGAGNGLRVPDSGLGLNYLHFCGDVSCDSSTPAAIVGRAITGILNGDHADCYVEYDCHAPGEKRWFIARVKPIQGVPGMRVLVLHDNVTPLRQTQEQLRRANAILRRLLNRRRRPLSNDEVKRVEAACHTAKQQLIVYSMLDTGIRVSELSCVALCDFDANRRGLRVRRDDEGARLLPLTERAAALWDEFLAKSGAFDLSTRQIQRIVRMVGEKAGITALSPQSLRETFAVRLVEDGADPEVLGYAMGYQQQTIAPEQAFAELARLIPAS